MIDSYHLYLTGTRARLRRQSGWPWRRRTEAIGEWDWDAAMPASLTLGSLFVSRKIRPALHIYVGSALSKFMAIELPAGLRSPQERGAAAQAQMQHQLGLVAADWEFTLDREPLAAMSVICAVRRELIVRVRQLATEKKFRLVSVQPYAAVIWNVVIGKVSAAEVDAESALLVFEDDAFTVLISRAGQLVAFNAMHHRREQGLIEREIKRLTYTLGHAAMQRIALILTRDIIGLAQGHADQIMSVTGPGDPLYPDFRDLLLSHEVIDTGAIK